MKTRQGHETQESGRFQSNGFTTGVRSGEHEASTSGRQMKTDWNRVLEQRMARVDQSKLRCGDSGRVAALLGGKAPFRLDEIDFGHDETGFRKLRSRRTDLGRDSRENPAHFLVLLILDGRNLVSDLDSGHGLDEKSRAAR